jgi:AraC-like DNA-binding protein
MTPIDVANAMHEIAVLESELAGGSTQAAELLIQRFCSRPDPITEAVLRQRMFLAVWRAARLLARCDVSCRFCNWLSTVDWHEFSHEFVKLFSDATPYRVSRENTLAHKASEMIRATFRSQISVDSLATQLACHRRTLERTFRRAYGVSVHSFIVEVRTREAVSLLTNTDLKVAAVAIEVGFRSRTSLRTAIVRATGRAPGELRRACIGTIEATGTPGRTPS